VRDLVVTDVAPFTLGIAISKRFGPEIATAISCRLFTATRPSR
jgi:hypothetical protein